MKSGDKVKGGEGRGIYKQQQRKRRRRGRLATPPPPPWLPRSALCIRQLKRARQPATSDRHYPTINSVTITITQTIILPHAHTQSLRPHRSSHPHQVLTPILPDPAPTPVLTPLTRPRAHTKPSRPHPVPNPHAQTRPPHPRRHCASPSRPQDIILL